MCAEYKEFCDRWGWYKTVETMADGDLLRFNGVLQTPFVEVVTLILYQRDKAPADKAQRKFLKTIKYD